MNNVQTLLKKQLEVTDELIADGESLDKLLKIFVNRLGKEKELAIKTIVNRRLLKGFFHIELLNNESCDDGEVADLQLNGQEQHQEEVECFNMGSYEVFDGYVLIQPDMPYTIPIRLTKAELKELLDAE